MLPRSRTRAAALHWPTPSLGERVANFDFYVVGGLGMLSIAKYYAVYDEDAPDGEAPTALNQVGTVAKVPLNVGVGMNFFISGGVALKFDARNYLYFDGEPQYNPDIPVTSSRLYNNFVASVGVSVFIPKMKQRQYDF